VASPGVGAPQGHRPTEPAQPRPRLLSWPLVSAPDLSPPANTLVGPGRSLGPSAARGCRGRACCSRVPGQPAPLGSPNGIVRPQPAAAGVAGILASPKPPIDVWHILQGSARALLHRPETSMPTPGRARKWTSTSVLTRARRSSSPPSIWCSRMSDTACLAALLLAAVAVGAMKRPGRRGLPPWSCPALVVLYPARPLRHRAGRGPKPLLLASIAGMVVGRSRRGGRSWPWCVFTAALVTKQHVLIIAPPRRCVAGVRLEDAR